MSFKLTIGRLAFAGRDLYTNEAISAIMPTKDIYPEFLYYGLQHWNLTGDSDQAVKGVTLNKQKLQEIPCLLPPLPEQKKIAEILSGADKLISALNRKECYLRRLLDGAINEMFFGLVEQGSFEEKRLCDIVNPERPITYGIVQTGEALQRGIPCVRVVDFVSEILNPFSMIKTSPKISSQYNRTILQEGDLLVALRGDIGRTEIARGNLAGANLTRGVALLSKSPCVNPEYLRYAMSSPFVKRQIKDGTNGSALQEIPLKHLREILVPVPPLSRQEFYSASLKSIESLIFKTLTERRSLELGKCAISSDLLSGRKRVTV